MTTFRVAGTTSQVLDRKSCKSCKSRKICKSVSPGVNAGDKGGAMNAETAVKIFIVGGTVAVAAWYLRGKLGVEI